MAMNNTILQWNVNGYYKRLSELKILLNKYQPKVICLQETHLTPNHAAIISQYTGYRFDHQEGLIASGGVATFVHRSTHANPIYLNTNFQTVTTEIHISNTKKITICNIYIPPNQRFKPEDLQSLERQLSKPYLILGDTNTHSTLIGSDRTDYRGRKLEKFLFDNDNIHVLNNGSPTHFTVNTGKFSSIDISLATTTLAEKFSWKTHEDLCTSDHFPIIVNEPLNNPAQTSQKYLFGKADWNTYEVTKMVTDNASIETKLNTLHRAIKEATQQTIPSKKSSNKNHQVPWLDSGNSRTHPEKKKGIKNI